MSLVLAQILGLGKAPSAFGTTLSLLLTWVVIVGGVTAALLWMIARISKAEHLEDLQRVAEFDAKHSDGE